MSACSSASSSLSFSSSVNVWPLMKRAMLRAVFSCLVTDASVSGGVLFRGVMIPMKRERMLTIRVTDDEHARLLERCEGKQLAVWMRRVCLGEPVARSGKLPTLAPPLLRQLAAIGNNLNQTARKVNSGQWSSGDRVQVVAALMAIGDELRRLRLAVREQGARDDS